ncbi:MAG: EamA family transporter [Ignavibacteriaceae bacterium]|nr:EamA family transporter [Ignavibacteriaceae bacterium]
MDSNLKIASNYILICLIWGSTWFAIRLGLDSLTPLISAGLRFSIAAIVIYIIMQIRSISIQQDKISMRLYYFMGVFSFILPFGLVYWGEQFIPSGLAAVLFAVYPFFVALFTRIFIPEEKIGLIKIFGMIFGFSGIVIIFSQNIFTIGMDYFLGMLAVLVSGLLQSTIAVSIKKYGQHLHALSMNLIPMAIAGVGMLLLGVLFEDTSSLKFDTKAIASVFYLGIIGSVVTFTAYYWLLKRINIILLSLTAFITPIIALLIGWIFLDETLMPNQIFGSFFVLTGLLIANLSSLKQKIMKK